MKKKAAVPRTLPRFKSEDEERAFWSRGESSDWIDWEKAKEGSFPKLKPSTTSISIRLPDSMLNELRILANQRDVPYQSLVKVFLAERIDAERKRKRVA